MKKKLCLLLSIITLVVCLIPAAVADVSSLPEKHILVHGNEYCCTFDNVQIPLSVKPLIYGGKCHIPLEDVLPALGFMIDWDTSQNAYILTRGDVVSYLYPARSNIWVGGDEYVFSSLPLVLSGRTYISPDVFYALTGYGVKCESLPDEYMNVTLLGAEKFCYVNGTKTPLSQTPVIYGGIIYLPVEEILPALGFSLSWDENAGGYSVTRGSTVSFLFPSRNNIWVGPTEHVFDKAPLVISGKTLISDQMFAALTGSTVTAEGVLPKYKDRYSINSSVRTDAYRLAGNSVTSGKGVTVIDGFGMELPSLSDSSARAYASVINSVAASLPQNIDVYNIIVPTAAEYYAPMRYYPNQLSGIKTAYAALSERVTPVNIYDILAEKAGEKIYLKTDHHWSQRGAYYAYCEFLKYFDKEMDALSTFENYPSYNHVGSLAGFASGTAAGNIMRQSPELFERFMPKYCTTGTVYYDHYLSRKGYSVNAVSKTTNAYHNYIGGDNPVTVFDTTAQSDRTLVIIKESYGNAFATWALNNFKRVVVVDPRKFNGFQGNNTYFNLKTLCQSAGATDVLFINYPIAAASSPIRNAILNLK